MAACPGNRFLTCHEKRQRMDKESRSEGLEMWCNMMMRCGYGEGEMVMHLVEKRNKFVIEIKN